MRIRKRLLIAAAGLVGLTSQASSQVPGAPPVPGLPGAGLPGIGPGPAAPTPPKTLWGFLGLSKEQKEFCKRKICASPLGQLLNNSTAPLQALSGGLIPPFCPTTPTIAELADPGAVGAAAKIKLDEAGVKARKAAVRYLGTVDCHYWPEAEDGLIGALRGDRSECVRYEAALALGNGCCCTKKTIEALTIVVSCSNRDNAPKENSERVVEAARRALDHCLECHKAPAVVATPEGPKPETGAVPEKGSKNPVTPPVPLGPPAAQSDDSKPNGSATTGDAKPVTTSPVVPATATMPRPPASRPSGFEYYARIAQTPLEPILAEARRTALAHPLKAKTPSDQSLYRIIADSSAAAGQAKSADVSVEKAENRQGTLLEWLAIKLELNQPETAVISESKAKPPVEQKAVAKKVTPAAPAPSITPELAPSNDRSMPQRPYSPMPSTANAPLSTVTPYQGTSIIRPTAGPISPKSPTVEQHDIVSTPVSAPVRLPIAAPARVATEQSTPAAATAQPVSTSERVTAKPQSIAPAKQEVVAPKPTPRPVQVAIQEPVKAKPPVKAPAEQIVATPIVAPIVVAATPATKSEQRSVQEPAAPMPQPVMISLPVVNIAKRPAPSVANPTPMPVPEAVLKPMPVSSIPVMVPAPLASSSIDQPTMRAQQALAALSGNAPGVDRHMLAESLNALDLRSSPELVDKLRQGALDGTSSEERQAFIRALVRGRAMNPEVVAAFQQISHDPIPEVRAQATLGLATWNIRTESATSATALPMSTSLTKTSAVNPAVEQVTATGILGSQSMPRAQRAMEVFSDSASTNDRRAMADTLDAIDLRYSPELVRKLVEYALRDGPMEERQSCIRALVRGRAQYPEVIEALRQISHDPTPAIRAEATLGLARWNIAPQ